MKSSIKITEEKFARRFYIFGIIFFIAMIVGTFVLRSYNGLFFAMGFLFTLASIPLFVLGVLGLLGDFKKE